MNILKNKKGEGYIDIVIVVFVVMLMIALTTSVLPIFIKKAKLDTFADEVVRYAEIEGRIGTQTKVKINQMKNDTGLNPTAKWSTTGTIQLNNEFSLELTLETDIGFFSFGSFPIILTSKATGRSEVYWKD
ncbi:DUF4320 family protein [Alkaliphilus pronyensis]|uniref:DUF4320 family protein n=1 Tax=Alkaliphilus pronyensis TaxID=1482732 RepID=A0A6I0FG94_9FIRM|nr:DUF4320 family protein [Alkaliphilus pronyensis]KAB3537889.1 DUF4320 family protein [Alkaliphilus pronyensis]